MKTNTPDPEVLASFLDEAGICLATLNERLLAAESGDADADLVGEMFRAAHSMKGSAGFLNLTQVSKVTHCLETVLDEIRKERLTFSQNVVDALFQAFDTVSGLLAEIVVGNIGEINIDPTVQALEAVLGQQEEKSETLEPADELAPVPDWLRDSLELDDVLQCMVARANGQNIYAIQFSLCETLAQQRDPGHLIQGLESVLSVHAVLPLLSGPAGVDYPLRTYDLQTALLCSCTDELSDVLAGFPLPPCRAWQIGEGGELPEAIELGQRESVELGAHVESLAIRPDMAKHQPTWISESREELEAVEAELLAFEGDPQDGKHVNELFRMMHRLKSSCAAMGLEEMSRIAHNCESLLSLYREHPTPPDDTAFRALFQAKDFLQECLKRVVDGEVRAPDSHNLDDMLRQLIQGHQRGAEEWLPSWSLTDELQKKADESVQSGCQVFQVTLTLVPDTPMADLRLCMILGSLEAVSEVLYCHPTVQELEAGLESPPPLQVLLASRAGEADIREVLQVDLIDLYRLEPVSASVSASGMDENGRSGVAKGGRSLVAGADTVRVETVRLDHMMNVAGELVITKARVSQLSDRLSRQMDSLDLRGLETVIAFAQNQLVGGGTSGSSLNQESLRRLMQVIEQLQTAQGVSSELRDTAIELHRHTNTLQNSVMQARMVPIGPLFQRFHRLVRDVCKERGRQAVLKTAGESTELDKKLIDELTDPLTHLIRNSVDHGLEPPEDRKRKGKAEQGTVALKAFHEGSQICIRVSDDGRGLDPEKIRQKAVNNGLLTQEVADKLPDSEVFGLIFQPGFSTAEKVTNISGRGVGMDIVKSKVNELKGKIDIESDPGQGAVFTIRLPLTLAMIESLLVEIGRTRYAFPLEGVREIVEIGADDIRTVKGRGRVISLRDQVIGLVDLCQVMDVDPLENHGERLRAVITKGGYEPLAILVDRVLGDEEIVVKALGEDFHDVRGISGATVLGDGGIALILDIAGINELSHLGGAGWKMASEREAM